MGDTLDFPAFPGQPELDGMDSAQLLSCLERIQLKMEHLEEIEPEDMDSDATAVGVHPPAPGADRAAAPLARGPAVY